MMFIIVILLTALLMEGIGSYISVVGLSSLFAGDMIILAMAVILDVAKITSVSFLYQYWSEIKTAMKSYLTAAVLVLMLITSAGAFGYLSGAFQKAIQPNYEVALRVESYKKEQTGLLEEKKQLTEEQAKFNQQLAGLPAEFVAGRQRLIKSFKPEQDRIRARLDLVTKRTDELRALVLKTESENLEKDVHAGPITYVSKAFGVSMEDASKWIILTIIFVFDPLAIMLVIAANFLIKRRKDQKDSQPTPPDEPKKVDDGPSVPDEPKYDPRQPLEVNLEGLKDIVPAIPGIHVPELESAQVFVPVNELTEPFEAMTTTALTTAAGGMPPVFVPDMPPVLTDVDQVPVIEVEPPVVPDEPIVGFIDYPESSLAKLSINYPQALFREDIKMPSSKRKLYEEVTLENPIPVNKS